jgi:NADPH:quinone reductase
MKAIAYTTCLPATDPAALQDMVLPDPAAPTGRDLLIEVRAVSVNPVDAKQRAKSDPKGTPRILGFDGAGVVRAVGPDATLFQPGDTVFWAGAINRPGSNAELQLVDERVVGRMPSSLTFAEAAAMPLTTITAWEGLFDRLRIARDPTKLDEALLIVGGAGGVGSIAIQLAAKLTGMTVIATASRPETRDWCMDLGAHHVIDHREDMAAQVKALKRRVSRVFSTTNTAANWTMLCALLAPQGMICAIDEGTAVDMSLLRAKSAGFHWEGMFARSLFQTPDMEAQHRLLSEAAALLDAGTLRTTLTRHLGTITAENLRSGHGLVEGGTMIGKAVADGWA